ncbi:MAG: hypothetical protein AAF702_37925 [Chloroflexota bacterium]
MNSNVLERPESLARPLPLPFCGYPRAKDVAYHGLQILPENIPLVDFERARPHRSSRYITKPAVQLSPDQRLRMARVIAEGFNPRETVNRHLQLPQDLPDDLLEYKHVDPFGCDSFGEWTKENITYWFIRLFKFTDPASPRSAVQLNAAVLDSSMVLVNEDEEVLGGVISEPMPSITEPETHRPNDPFIAAVLSFFEPIYTLLDAQDAEAIPALCARYPAFQDAYTRGKVGHPVIAASVETLPSKEAFELVAATAERYQQLGYIYVLTEATHPWAGSAWEALGAARVHYAPFRTQQRVSVNDATREDVLSSSDGFIADRDSGSMCYVLRLK